jgi:hypothetical protein
MTNRQINLLRLVAEAADWLLLAHAQAADTNTAAATHATRLARQIETAITAMDLERELAEAHAARQGALQAAQASGGLWVRTAARRRVARSQGRETLCHSGISSRPCAQTAHSTPSEPLAWRQRTERNERRRSRNR